MRSLVLFIRLQKCVPQHLLSRIIGSLSRWRAGLLKNIFIRYFVRHYGVNVDEIESFTPNHYANFNEFFTRHLKAGVRPIADGADKIISPADGVISEIGTIADRQLLQAKGHYYDVATLLGGEVELAQRFVDGSFITIYLAPKDYHRIHMPLKGQLQQMIHVPGKLFSVNTATVQVIPDLFARNERVVSVFNTAIGPMAVILVGAMLVGSIETVWHGVVTPPAGRCVQQWDYTTQAIEIERGAEMGNFNMGSTAIVLLPKDTAQWLAQLEAGTELKMGQAIGQLN